MGAVASLEPTALAVEPGSEMICEIKVRNNGSVVDQFTLDVVGDTTRWTLIEPPTFSLLPNTEAAAVVRFRPPRTSALLAGVYPFGIRVSPKEDPAGGVVEEGTVEVLPFREVFAELTPHTVRGKREARTELAVDNRGNGPLFAQLSATDPNDALLFHFSPLNILAAPNTAVFSKVGVRPRKRFLRGTPKTHMFQVLVQPVLAPPPGSPFGGPRGGPPGPPPLVGPPPGGPPPGPPPVGPPSGPPPVGPPHGPPPVGPPPEGVALEGAPVEGAPLAGPPHIGPPPLGPPEVVVEQPMVEEVVIPPVVLDGVMLQEAILPRWFFKALLAVLGILALLAILWFALLRPVIKSEAKKAVAAPLASQAAVQQAAQQQAAATQAQQAAQVAAGQKQLGDAVAKITGTPVALPTITGIGPGGSGSSLLGLGNPFRIRLPQTATSFPPGSTNQSSYTVPANSTLNMADILLENPQGDSGTLTVLQDANVLLVENLDNFRDLDYHFVSPPQFTAGQKLVVTVTCAANSGALANPPAPGRPCTPSIFVSGFLKGP